MTSRETSFSLYEPRVNNISKYSRLHQLIHCANQMSTGLADIELALTHLSAGLQRSQKVYMCFQFADRIRHEFSLSAPSS
jgi:hypothetical protein